MLNSTFSFETRLKTSKAFIKYFILIILFSFSESNIAQDYFWVAPYSAKRGTGTGGGYISDVARDHFNIGGFTYARDYYFNDDMNDYLNNNLDVVYRLWPLRTVNTFGAVGTFIRATSTEIQNASNDQMNEWMTQIQSSIHKVLDNTSLNNGVKAWYFGPEEVRPWIANELKLFEMMYDSVQALDPQQRPCFTYNPQHANSERLLNQKHVLDYWCVGAYPHTRDNEHNRLQIVWAIKQMNDANNSLAVPKLVLPALEMFEDSNNPFSPEDAALIPEFVNHDAYVSVANGADGILIWSMGNRSGFTNYTKYYNAYAKFSKETYNLGLRDVFHNGTVVNRAVKNVTAGEDIIRFLWKNNSGSIIANEDFPSLSFREWDYNEKNYLLVVNSSEDTVAFTLSNLLSNQYQNVFDSTTYNVTSGEIDLSLPARGVILLSDDVIVGVQQDKVLSNNYTLYQNYPNPFNPSTNIQYTLPNATDITIEVFDVLGNRITTLINSFQHAGTHQVSWDGKNINGVDVSSGIYIYKLRSNSSMLVKKMLLIR